MSRRILPAAFSLAGMFGLGYYEATTYIGVMYDGQRSSVSWVEGANYAVQTITTVGYGNWESPFGLPTSATQDLPLRVFKLRYYSAYFMFFGATLYAVFTGAIVALLIPPSERPERH
jgi:hypothetical protein